MDGIEEAGSDFRGLPRFHEGVGIKWKLMGGLTWSIWSLRGVGSALEFMWKFTSLF